MLLIRPINWKELVRAAHRVVLMTVTAIIWYERFLEWLGLFGRVRYDPVPPLSITAGVGLPARRLRWRDELVPTSRWSRHRMICTFYPRTSFSRGHDA